MLIELSIRNFAIIEEAQIRFDPGLNVLTGETGAGKSILIDALGAVLGERTSADMVRTGASGAAIDATFDLDKMAGHEPLMALLSDLRIAPADEGLLILSREIQGGGRSSARLNGRPTTASVLAEIGALIVDVHGQSDHLSLLRPAAQLDLLDRFAQVNDLRQAVSERVAELRSVRTALADAISGSRERMQRIDLLRYQIDEIRAASLSVDEEAKLQAEHARLVNVERLSRDAALVFGLLAGNDEADESPTALPALRHAVSVFDELASLDANTRPLRERLNEVLFLLEDVAADVRDYRDNLESDPARLEQVEERIALLRQLKRKYGADATEVLRFAEDAEAELGALTGSDVDAEALTEREAMLAVSAGELAARLSRRRREAAGLLAANVERSISDLKMGSAEFAVALDRAEDPNGVPVRLDEGKAAKFAIDATGIDRATFLIAPNAGEGLKPLGRIASGGETARLMLALKSILSEADETPTLIFDEIDVGVGGRSGQVVGEKLAHLAETHQVITITHLPQIAAYADTHFRIAKTERLGRVVSTVDKLGEIERVDELAAMIDGAPLTESSRQSAREMFERARASRQDGVRR